MLLKYAKAYKDKAISLGSHPEIERELKFRGLMRGGADEDVDAELAALMGALPMPGEERPAAPAPAPRRVQRIGRVAMFEPPLIRVPARGVQYRRGTKRTLERRESGRGKGICKKCGKSK